MDSDRLSRPQFIDRRVGARAFGGLGAREPQAAAAPTVGPSTRLDYELEMGIFIGPGNALGAPIPMADAENHIFGLCLLNDWSARDLQGWEYQPLGPFLAKNFATTISPWVVTLRCARALSRSVQSARVGSPAASLSGLSSKPRIGRHRYSARSAHPDGEDARPAASRRNGSLKPAFATPIGRIAQLVAHHTVNGCNLRPGDLFGSGTQSGPTPAEAGSLVELSKGGTQALPIGKDEHRTFLEDGDTVIFRGWCERPGAASIGFGELSGRGIAGDSRSIASSDRLGALTLLSALFLQPRKTLGIL